MRTVRGVRIGNGELHGPPTIFSVLFANDRSEAILAISFLRFTRLSFLHSKRLQGAKCDQKNCNIQDWNAWWWSFSEDAAHRKDQPVDLSQHLALDRFFRVFGGARVCRFALESLPWWFLRDGLWQANQDYGLF